MAVPKFSDFFPVVLSVLNNGSILSVREIRDQAADLLGISPEDRAIMLPSGKQRMADNRTTWAMTYLKKAC